MKNYILICFAIAVTLVALPNTSVGESSQNPMIIPQGFGVNIHFAGEPRDLDMIQEAGFRFIRMDLQWESIERAKGVYDFTTTGYDALTAGCEKRGIQILYIFGYSNHLYETDNSIQTPEGREAFARFSETAAKRYAGKGIHWEFCNEPNLFIFWTPQPSFEDYTLLVNYAAPRIKKADPSGTVAAGAAASIGMIWIEECFKRGLLDSIDELTIHPYRPGTPPETALSDYNLLRDLIALYAPPGKKIPIISGEWGYTLIDWDKTTSATETQQAQSLSRMFLTNLIGGLPVSIWYDWKDDGTEPLEGEHHFGVMHHDLSPKPAYYAIKTLSHTLDGYSLTKRIPLMSDGDFVVQLTRGSQHTLALWTMVNDHDVLIPIEQGEGILVDIMGIEKPVSWGKNGLTVTLNQSPQYLIIK